MTRHPTASRSWRQWSEPQARKILARFARSGVSLSAFARTRGWLTLLGRLAQAQREIAEPMLLFTAPTRKVLAAERERWRSLPDVLKWVRERYPCPELRRLM